MLRSIINWSDFVQPSIVEASLLVRSDLHDRRLSFKHFGKMLKTEKLEEKYVTLGFESLKNYLVAIPLV